MVVDQLLSKLGLQYEDLSAQEKQTYESWSKSLDIKPLTAEEIKEYIKQAREAVELELVDEDEFVYVLGFKKVNRRHVGLKARLKNYLLLEAFLTSKERAKQALEKQIQKMAEERNR